MRVITGSARGRRLIEPQNSEIRPTTDRVKEAIFNICQFDVEGRRVLDLFGGTGQLGIEAKSRGAAQVDIVDASRESIRLIHENVRLVGLDVRVIQTDALSYLERCGAYDLIFIDPPYDSGLAEKALGRIKAFDILSNGGIIICETRTYTELLAPGAPYRMKKQYVYGKVKLTTFTKETLDHDDCNLSGQL